MVKWLLPILLVVALQWDANTETDLAGYKIYYREFPHGEFTEPATVLAPSTRGTVTGLTDGIRYEFVVTAYNTSGLESVYSNSVYVGNHARHGGSFRGTVK